MAQHDYTIANQTFPNTRTDLNNVFAAIVSQNSGATAPSTTYAYQLWYDTTTDILKMRNANDDAWIDLFTIDQVADAAAASLGADVTISGDLTVDTSTLYVDSTNNRVGVGTTSPSTILDVEGANINFASSENGILNVFSNDAAAVDKGGSISLGGNSDSGSLGFAMIKGAKEGTDSGYISFGTRTAAAYSTERMRIESGGAISSYQPSSGGTTHMKFINGASQVGSITSNTVSTFYNTSSDYRLKENVTADWDATTRLKQLNPVRFNFIADADTTVDGFLAHEVSHDSDGNPLVPEAISGTKDAMRDEEYEVTPAVEATYDDDGNVLTEAVPAVMGTRSVPDYQGIDQSKLVPLLVKTIQELEARITALEAN